MRAMQFIGLSPAAEAFLKRQGIPTYRHWHKCPHCGERSMVFGAPLSWPTKRYVEGYANDRVHMRDYPLETEQIAREVLQLREDYCGPMYFTCLVVDGVKMCEWTDEELKEHLA